MHKCDDEEDLEPWECMQPQFRVFPQLADVIHYLKDRFEDGDGYDFEYVRMYRDGWWSQQGEIRWTSITEGLNIHIHVPEIDYDM